jgi:hypothetical protein
MTTIFLALLTLGFFAVGTSYSSLKNSTRRDDILGGINYFFGIVAMFFTMGYVL